MAWRAAVEPGTGTDQEGAVPADARAQDARERRGPVRGPSRSGHLFACRARAAAGGAAGLRLAARGVAPTVTS
eukprot:5569866-Prymnesium_polylepis.1